MKTLHCPRCGYALTSRSDGTLECVRGQMPLSRDLATRLTDCYVTEVRRPREPELARITYRGGIGGTWFCPGCGVHAQEQTPWDLRCPTCSRSLFEFVYALVERHTHCREPEPSPSDRHA